MWSWTLYFLHHFHNCYAFWVKKIILCSEITQLCLKERLIVFHHREILHARLLCASCKMYDGYLNQITQYHMKLTTLTLSFTEATQSHFLYHNKKILNEWKAERQSDCLVGNRWAPGRTWSRRRWERRRGRRGMRRPCCWQGWMETHSIWSLWRDSTASVKDQPAHPSRLTLRKMVSSLKTTPLEAL